MTVSERKSDASLHPLSDKITHLPHNEASLMVKAHRHHGKNTPG